MSQTVTTPEDLPNASEALVIHPGDILLLRYDKVLSQFDLEQLKPRVMERLPMLADVVVISGCQQVAVIRTPSFALDNS